MTPFHTYIENLCRRHHSIRHTDKVPHFASSADSAQTAMARRLHYPAVFLDVGDFDFAGDNSHKIMRRSISIAFVTHVRDSGNAEEIQTALNNMEQLMMDFIAQMDADRKACLKVAMGVQLAGGEAHRVELEGAGLYGWMLFFVNEKGLNICLQDNPFEMKW